ncbi:MAG TPA: hypothetical protein VE261_08125 [Gaiellaceae bacterium]|nr:hypothetical protein [Gaiellaceae bacterium]
MAPTIGALFVVAVVVAILALVGYVLFQLTPFAHHGATYRDPRTGKRRFESPHLETWDEFEQRTHDNLN